MIVATLISRTFVLGVMSCEALGGEGRGMGQELVKMKGNVACAPVYSAHQNYYKEV